MPPPLRYYFLSDLLVIKLLLIFLNGYEILEVQFRNYKFNWMEIFLIERKTFSHVFYLVDMVSNRIEHGLYVTQNFSFLQPRRFKFLQLLRRMKLQSLFLDTLFFPIILCLVISNCPISIFHVLPKRLSARESDQLLVNGRAPTRNICVTELINFSDRLHWKSNSFVIKPVNL